MTVEVYERWLPVADWEGWYEVSCRGRVRSVDRWVIHIGDNRRRFCRGRVLTPGLVRGYPFVGLTRPGVKRYIVTVHILVLRAFAGPPKPGEHGLHGPGGKQDNRWPENLYYGTRERNMGPDRVRDGTDSRGERSWSAKLTEAAVRDCRVRYAAGETQSSLAREYGVNPTTVRYAINGRHWAHVE